MINWLVRHPVAANVVMWLLVIGGYFASQDLRRALLPDTELATVRVTVVAAGASPSAIEVGVLLPLERFLSDLPELKRVVSTAKQGVGYVEATLRFGVDIDSVVDEIKLRVARSRQQMPPNVEEPLVESVELPQVATYLVIASPKADRSALRALSDAIRRDLSRKVSQVDAMLMSDEQTTVTVDPSALERFNLSFKEVAAAIKTSAVGLSTGVIQSGVGQIALSTQGAKDSVASLGQIIVRTDSSGGRIRLSELASIEIGESNRFFHSEFDGMPAVFLRVATSVHDNLTDVSKIVHDYVEAPGVFIPESVSLKVWQDNARYFNQRMDLLTTNAWQGFGLVLIMLMVFMRADLGFWVALGIPVAYCGAMIMMTVLGVSLNMVSLFAFILVLGVVVDDAIIVGEHIFTKQHRQLNPYNAAIEGVRGVMKPVIVAVVTTILTFVPLLMLPGIEGQLVRDVPLVAISVLLFSLFECLCLLPAHLVRHRGFARPQWAGMRFISMPLNSIQSSAHRLMHRCIIVYSHSLMAAVRFRYVVVSLFCATVPLCVALVVTDNIELQLVSRINSELLRIEATFDKSIDEEGVSEGISMLQQIVESQRVSLFQRWGQHQIQHVSTNWGMKGKGYDDHAGTVFVELAALDQLRITPDDLAKKIEAEAQSIRGLETLSAGAWLVTPGPDLFYDFQGPNAANLEMAVKAVQHELQQLEGVYNVQTSLASTRPALDIRVRSQAGDLGLSPEEVARQIQAAFHGVEVKHTSRSDEFRKLIVEIPKADRDSVRSLESLKLVTPDGFRVPLTTVAEIVPTQTSSKIVRENRERVLRVSAYVDPGVNSKVALKRAIVESVLDPLAQQWSVSWSLSGAQKGIGELLDEAVRWFGFSLMVMTMLIIVLFRSYTQPFLILIAIPWGLIGALFGHCLLNLPFTLWSVMGMIAVSGIVVNDNLVLVDCINQNNKGNSIRGWTNAVLSGGMRRFRAIIITSITTVVGLIPIMFETSIQAQFLIPMAVSVAFGVAFSTFVTLYLVPCLILIACDLKRLIFPQNWSNIETQHQFNSLKRKFVD